MADRLIPDNLPFVVFTPEDFTHRRYPTIRPSPDGRYPLVRPDLPNANGDAFGVVQTERPRPGMFLASLQPGWSESIPLSAIAEPLYELISHGVVPLSELMKETPTRKRVLDALWDFARELEQDTTKLAHVSQKFLRVLDGESYATTVLEGAVQTARGTWDGWRQILAEPQVRAKLLNLKKFGKGPWNAEFRELAKNRLNQEFQPLGRFSEVVRSDTPLAATWAMIDSPRAVLPPASAGGWHRVELAKRALQVAAGCVDPPEMIRQVVAEGVLTPKDLFDGFMEMPSLGGDDDPIRKRAEHLAAKVEDGHKWVGRAARDASVDIHVPEDLALVRDANSFRFALVNGFVDRSLPEAVRMGALRSLFPLDVLQKLGNRQHKWDVFWHMDELERSETPMGEEDQRLLAMIAVDIAVGGVSREDATIAWATRENLQARWFDPQWRCPVNRMGAFVEEWMRLVRTRPMGQSRTDYLPDTALLQFMSADDHKKLTEAVEESDAWNGAEFAFFDRIAEDWDLQWMEVAAFTVSRGGRPLESFVEDWTDAERGINLYWSTELKEAKAKPGFEHGADFYRAWKALVMSNPRVRFYRSDAPVPKAILDRVEFEDITVPKPEPTKAEVAAAWEKLKLKVTLGVLCFAEGMDVPEWGSPTWESPLKNRVLYTTTRNAAHWLRFAESRLDLGLPLNRVNEILRAMTDTMSPRMVLDGLRMYLRSHAAPITPNVMTVVTQLFAEMSHRLSDYGEILDNPAYSPNWNDTLGTNAPYAITTSMLSPGLNLDGTLALILQGADASPPRKQLARMILGTLRDPSIHTQRTFSGRRVLYIVIGRYEDTLTLAEARAIWSGAMDPPEGWEDGLQEKAKTLASNWKFALSCRRTQRQLWDNQPAFTWVSAAGIPPQVRDLAMALDLCRFGITMTGLSPSDQRFVHAVDAMVDGHLTINQAEKSCEVKDDIKSEIPWRTRGADWVRAAMLLAQVLGNTAVYPVISGVVPAAELVEGMTQHIAYKTENVRVSQENYPSFLWKVLAREGQDKPEPIVQRALMRAEPLSVHRTRRWLEMALVQSDAPASAHTADVLTYTTPEIVARALGVIGAKTDILVPAVAEKVKPLMATYAVSPVPAADFRLSPDPQRAVLLRAAGAPLSAFRSDGTYRSNDFRPGTLDMLFDLNAANVADWLELACRMDKPHEFTKGLLGKISRAQFVDGVGHFLNRRKSGSLGSATRLEELAQLVVQGGVSLQFALDALSDSAYEVPVFERKKVDPEALATMVTRLAAGSGLGSPVTSDKTLASMEGLLVEILHPKAILKLDAEGNTDEKTPKVATESKQPVEKLDSWMEKVAGTGKAADPAQEQKARERVYSRWLARSVANGSLPVSGGTRLWNAFIANDNPSHPTDSSSEVTSTMVDAWLEMAVRVQKPDVLLAAMWERADIADITRSLRKAMGMERNGPRYGVKALEGTLKTVTAMNPKNLVEFVLFWCQVRPGEGHGMSLPSLQQEVLRRGGTWQDYYNGLEAYVQTLFGGTANWGSTMLPPPRSLAVPAEVHHAAIGHAVLLRAARSEPEKYAKILRNWRGSYNAYHKPGDRDRYDIQVLWSRKDAVVTDDMDEEADTDVDPRVLVKNNTTGEQLTLKAKEAFFDDQFLAAWDDLCLASPYLDLKSPNLYGTMVPPKLITERKAAGKERSTEESLLHAKVVYTVMRGEMREDTAKSILLGKMSGADRSALMDLMAQDNPFRTAQMGAPFVARWMDLHDGLGNYQVEFLREWVSEDDWRRGIGAWIQLHKKEWVDVGVLAGSTFGSVVTPHDSMGAHYRAFELAKAVYSETIGLKKAVELWKTDAVMIMTSHHLPTPRDPVVFNADFVKTWFEIARELTQGLDTMNAAPFMSETRGFIAAMDYWVPPEVGTRVLKDFDIEGKTDERLLADMIAEAKEEPEEVPDVRQALGKRAADVTPEERAAFATRMIRDLEELTVGEKIAAEMAKTPDGVKITTDGVDPRTPEEVAEDELAELFDGPMGSDGEVGGTDDIDADVKVLEPEDVNHTLIMATGCDTVGTMQGLINGLRAAPMASLRSGIIRYMGDRGRDGVWSEREQLVMRALGTQWPKVMDGVARSCGTEDRMISVYRMSGVESPYALTRVQKAMAVFKDDLKEIALRAGVRRVREAARVRVGQWWLRHQNPQQVGETEDSYRARLEGLEAAQEAFLASDMGMAATAMLLGFVWTVVGEDVTDGRVRQFGDAVAREFRVSAGVDIADGLLDMVIEAMQPDPAVMGLIPGITGVRVLPTSAVDGEDSEDAAKVPEAQRQEA